MSGQPKRASALLHALTMTARPPREYDRKGRVELIGEAARLLVESGTPEGLFVGGALRGWLENGGRLERDYLQVTKPKSHATPAALWREIRAHRDERQAAQGARKIAPTDLKTDEGEQ